MRKELTIGLDLAPEDVVQAIKDSLPECKTVLGFLDGPGFSAHFTMPGEIAFRQKGGELQVFKVRNNPFMPMLFARVEKDNDGSVIRGVFRRPLDSPAPKAVAKLIVIVVFLMLLVSWVAKGTVSEKLFFSLFCLAPFLFFLIGFVVETFLREDREIISRLNEVFAGHIAKTEHGGRPVEFKDSGKEGAPELIYSDVAHGDTGIISSSVRSAIRPTVLLATCVWAGGFISFGIYSFIAHLAVSRSSAALAGTDLLPVILGTIGGVLVVGGVVLKRYIFSQRRAQAFLTRETGFSQVGAKNLTPEELKLVMLAKGTFVPYMMSLGMIQSCVLFGMILSIIQHDLQAFIPHLVGGIAGLFLCFPRFKTFLEKSLVNWKHSLRPGS